MRFRARHRPRPTELLALCGRALEVSVDTLADHANSANWRSRVDRLQVEIQIDTALQRLVVANERRFKSAQS
jgi:hypothetical protein